MTHTPCSICNFFVFFFGCNSAKFVKEENTGRVGPLGCFFFFFVLGVKFRQNAKNKNKRDYSITIFPFENLIAKF